MSRFVATIGASILAVSAVAICAATPALAYVSAGYSSASVSPATAGPGVEVTFSGAFKDQYGQGIAGASVTFTQQSGPSNCQIIFNPTSATTGASGIFSMTVTLPAKCPGEYVLAASTQGTTVTASVSETGGLPATTIVAHGTPAGQPALPIPVLVAGLVLVLIVLGAVGLIYRRR
jgi:hypothetical protein